MIRTLNQNDVDAFIEIRKLSLALESASFGASPHAPIDREKTLKDLRVKNEENFILGYFDQSKLVAILGFFRYKNEKTRHKGYIWGVFVHQEYRGQNIGRRLMEECINQVSALPGMQKILLGASHISEAALSLYSSLGFEQYGREINAMICDGMYIDEILMEKILH